MRMDQCSDFAATPAPVLDGIEQTVLALRQLRHFGFVVLQHRAVWSSVTQPCLDGGLCLRGRLPCRC